MTSCVDKNEEVDAKSKPEWLGGSIYSELQNPKQDALTGSFSYYLRLIDDLGQTDLFNRTGSITVFPANDEAFQRFFQNNEWGVSTYEDLTQAQKNLLLNSSLLENAMLVNMLSNTNSNGSIVKGVALKHSTRVDVTDSISHIYSAAGMPVNNRYWQKYFSKGIDLVCDATTPMMVHLTREYMVSNAITMQGDGSDFQVLTGEPYTSGATYIFNNPVITKGSYSDGMTCQNGYIHQVRDVLLPPGNLAQEVKKDAETSLISRMLEYFSAPFYNNAVTQQYNAAAIQYGKPAIDSIFEKRYFSKYSQTGELSVDPDKQPFSALLKFDPGWNAYQVASTSGGDNSLKDLGAMFVPVDKAVQDFFIGGDGAYLMDIYAKHKPVTADNLAQNIDSLFAERPDIISKFLANMQNISFAGSVPSKFSLLTNDAGENLGMTVDKLQTKSDGTYDVKFANNAVMYKLNTMLAPDEFSAVLAPASTYKDLRVMDHMIQASNSQDGCDFKYYLLAMAANYAFFIPEDSAFSQHYYVDPTTLAKAQPEALAFRVEWNERNKKDEFNVYRYKYDLKTNTVGDFLSKVSSSTSVKSHIIDILNMHTVVLDAGETLGARKYYKTKHGGAIMVEGTSVGGKISSGAQIDNGQAKSEILSVYNQRNGISYRLNQVIEAPRNSVYKTLSNYEVFSDFFELCNWLSSSTTLMDAVGISSSPSSLGVSEQDGYIVFTSTYGTGSSKITNACVDQNVKMFNTYNYTLYAPTNTAMNKAYEMGLPRTTEVEADYEVLEGMEEGDSEREVLKNKIKLQVKELRDFVRYHFQNVSLFADKVFVDEASGRYASLLTDETGVAIVNRVSGSLDEIKVTDNSGIEHTVNANSGIPCNVMARDYWFDKDKTAINTSSFCVVHGIDTPLNFHSDTGRYDGNWKSPAAMAKALRAYQIYKANNNF
ncbi:MAG: hypothetical protein ACI4BA_05175 [Prevotella sp.]